MHAVKVHEVGVLKKRVSAELKRAQAVYVVQAESAGDGAKPALEGQSLDAGQAGYIGSGAFVLQGQDLRIDPEPEQGSVQSLHRDPGSATRVAHASVYVQDSHVVHLVASGIPALAREMGKTGAGCRRGLTTQVLIRLIVC